MSRHTQGPWAARISLGVWVIQNDGEEFLATVKHRSDARLIAAVPELLEALKEFVAVNSMCYFGPERQQALDDVQRIASKAIAKAEGGAR